MASELRVNKLTNRSGLCTVTYSDTGAVFSGITTGTFSGDITGSVTGAVTATTGSFSGDISIADKIIHTGDTHTAIRFAGNDIITAEIGGTETFRIDSSGLKITDKLIHSGDTDTFLEFGTDTITLDTAGTERLRITSDGNVGIHQSSPVYPLHINSAMSSSPSLIMMQMTGSNTLGGGAGIAFDTSASNSVSNNSLFLATISGERSASNNGSNTLIFKTSRSGVNGDGGIESGPKTQMVIDELGDVGIGVSAPISRLHVHATDSGTDLSRIYVTNNTTGSTSVNEGLMIWQNGNNTFLSNNSNGWMVLRTNETERFRIDSGGNVAIGGNASPQQLLHVWPDTANTNSAYIRVTSGDRGSGTGIDLGSDADGDGRVNVVSNGNLKLYTNNAERLRLDNSGNMCLGGTPFSQGTGNTFCIHSSGTGGGDHAYIYFTNGDSGHTASDGMSIGLAANQVANVSVREAWPLAISTNGSERMRFLTDGEIVMGTASSGSADTLYVTGPTNSGQSTVKILGNGNNGPQANTCALDVQQNCDGAPNTSPALKLTHTNTLAGTEGAIMSIYTNTNNGTAQTGWVYHTTGRIIHNRPSTDGTLFSFRHNSSSEGNIAISGSTVSYNGGHLSRWSQFVGLSTTSKAARPTIYQGTVLSNLDEMCEWTGEDNQQLNKTKVSDTVGDKDVAGVFWTWDEEDDETGYVNDFYVAMTGDMVIRVAGSTSVARGDLLESAGDGTAKPQSDDIIRSKTIAKIISTTSTATYADGSKAYPCVLMAC